MVTIRRAERTDCEAMMSLIKELAAYEKAPDAVTVSMDEFVESGFGSNPVWGAFVAERDNTIVGLALYYIRYSTWKGRRLYLEDLVVTEKERGNGIGKQLLDRTIAWAREANYSGIMWQVLNWNEPAINFYKKYQAEFDEEWINVSLSFRQ
ncbi:L-amino acid N-acyltransferase YncA [Sphingobacterium allocomposti]|uniref:L-amino acid N-acyltransferase YncA n=1 Tax=Sphingobacterium allocomposti TaxID=415956 RepID=A0A5S5DKP3_9SPHI|nr:GNAT family N-acetyltransferase [Sphingobacterium composti Yoo et al. 2007 non Ten et al. 2007]TYP96520.1 L-amino acid N-acyltransferase YncA [Sphingobacterium composti Yoo et al. 2007 non Ten et al. 2007]